MTIRGHIRYTMKPNHPDIGSVKAIPNETQMFLSSSFCFISPQDLISMAPEKIAEQITPMLICEASDGYSDQDGVYIDVLSFYLYEITDEGEPFWEWEMVKGENAE